MPTGVFSMIILQSIVASIAVLLCTAQLCAQVEVYADVADKLDTTISFGATRPFTAISRSITVRNNSAVAVRIRPSITDINEQFSAVTVEFAGTFSAEVIAAGVTRSYTLIYKADHSPFPVDSLAQIRFVIDVDDAQTQRPIMRRIFICSGVKTNRLIATDQRVVSFDSVFISDGCSSSRTATLYGVTEANVAIEAQRVRPMTPVLGPHEITIDTFPDVEFAGINTVSWKCRYKPVNLGIDAVEFSVLYDNQADPSDSVVRVVLQGVGVSQDFALRGIRQIGSSLIGGGIRGDTIDLGMLPVISDSSKVAIAMQSIGNIGVGVDSVVFSPISGQVNEFFLRRGLSKWLPATMSDTIHVAFAPDVASAASVARLRIYTNLGRRYISCVPEASVVKEYIVVASRQQAFSVESGTLAYGRVVRTKGCDAFAERTITLRNNSNLECVIDSVTVDPLSGGARLQGLSGVVVPPRSSVSATCEFTPSYAGEHTGTVTLWLNTKQKTLVIPYSAQVVDAEPVELSAAGEYRAKPGSRIRIAVRSTNKIVSGIQRARIYLEANPTLLQYVDAIQQGTASEGALVNIGDISGGVVIDIEQDAGMIARDTLVLLDFNTYLGDSASTAIVVGEYSTLGTIACPDALPLIRSHGRFTLDSLCGLSYKTRTASSGLRGSLFPNPSSGYTNLIVESALQNATRIEIIDGFGRNVRSEHVKVNDGVLLRHLDVSALPSGQYTVVIECNGLMLRLPLAVAQ